MPIMGSVEQQEPIDEKKGTLMNDRIEKIKERGRAATPAPLKVGIVDPDLDPVEWFRQHLENGGEDVWVVWCPEHPNAGPLNENGNPEFCVLAAITGNGPTSEANAEFFAHAYEDMNYLLIQIEQLKAGTE